MRSLQGFSLSERDEIALCEVDGKLQCMNSRFADISAFTSSIEKLPKVHITSDMLHPLSSGDESRALLLPVNQTYLKNLVKIWHEQGFVEVLSSIKEKQHPVLLSTTASIILKSINALQKFRMLLNPYAREKTSKLISSVSQTQNWFSSPARCIAWHPMCTKLAVAALDDCVRIYTENSSLVPVLKFKQQKEISCLAWRPMSASEIAVGCENGIFIWTVDPNSVVTRPSISNVSVLRHINHTPIASLAWSPMGDLLASAAVTDSSLLVWDVSSGKNCPLKRAGVIGNVLLKWSPGGARLLAASTGLVFRVWDSFKWKAEHWSVVTGRIQSACWSPCGSILLFATTEEPMLYALSFLSSGTIFRSEKEQLPSMAQPVLDMSSKDLQNGRTIGGLVHTMDWDPRGHYLAVLFKDCSYVAIFATISRPVLQITPSCLVNGLAEELPSTIAFQKNFAEGSCLTIAWSSGRLQHFPLIYSDFSQSMRHFSHVETTRSPSSSFLSPTS